jgi:cytochrome c oxidase assembly factor CtaG
MVFILAQIRQVNQLWLLLPLIVVVSLVYGATRHERMQEILLNAYRAAKWIVGFIAVIFGVLLLISWFL